MKKISMKWTYIAGRSKCTSNESISFWDIILNEANMFGDNYLLQFGEILNVKITQILAHRFFFFSFLDSNNNLFLLLNSSFEYHVQIILW